MRIRVRARKVIVWGALLVASILAGGLGFAYTYITDSDTLAALIRKEVPKYLPGSSVRVGRVMLRPLVGDVQLKQVMLRQRLGGDEFQTLHIPWLQIRHDFRALLHGRLEPREVIVSYPRLRITRREDGTWNLQGLLADPWPAPPLPNEPVVMIRKGTVELVDDQGDEEAVLREVDLNLKPGPADVMRFEGTAKGGPFEHLKFEGTFDRRTGRLDLTQGDLTRLAVSDTLIKRLPADWRPILQAAGLKSGEIDLAVTRLIHDPAVRPPLAYEGSVSLRSGSWDCPEHLPFPLDNVSAVAQVSGGQIVLKEFSGRNGKTTVSMHGTLSADDPSNGPLNLHVEVFELELDARLKAKTPPDLAMLWDEYQPSGRVNVALDAVRLKPGEKVEIATTLDCLDVAMDYHWFRYALEHVRGTLRCTEELIEVDMATTIGGKPLTCKGTITDPGRPEAIVDLDFAAGAMPIDDKLMAALPDDARKVVQEFHPTGTVRGTTKVRRTPPQGPEDDPERGHITVDSHLDLNSNCAMMWDGLKYPIKNLTGHLELHPDRWIFTNMRGTNGLATIEAGGEVTQNAKGDREVKLSLKADHLPFDQQLRDALPAEWQATWALLNPKGSSKVQVNIHAKPGKEHYHLEITPEKETSVRLTLTPVDGTPGAERSKRLVLPKMDDVQGRFVFDDGIVTMSDVHFIFRESPVRFKTGKVVLRPNNQFELAVWNAEVERLRLDTDLQAIMPPVMAQFARRLDNGRPFRIHTDIGIAWSGRSGDPAVCQWREARVILNDNAIQAGFPLEHLQGEISNVRGRSDGRSIECFGVLNLDSAGILGQQVTRLGAPIEVKDGRARLSSLQGDLLGGELTGQVEISLDTTPRYAVKLQLREADLERYTRTLPGRQDMRGKVSGALDLSGLGNDLRSLQGKGSARLFDGDLGTLPFALRLFSALKLSKDTKTAFDSARVDFQVQNGLVHLDPLKFTGNAISLRGQGTVDFQGNLDLRLHPLYGRDERLPALVSDTMRGLGSQFFDIHVTGPASMPRLNAEPLPNAARRVSRAVQNLGRDRRRDAPPIPR